MPSFEELDQALLTGTQASGSKSAETANREGKQGSHRKSKIARRLHTELRESSPGFISDVDSDSEEQENCNFIELQHGYSEGRTEIVREKSPAKEFKGTSVLVSLFHCIYSKSKKYMFSLLCDQCFQIHTVQSNNSN